MSGVPSSSKTATLRPTVGDKANGKRAADAAIDEPQKVIRRKKKKSKQKSNPDQLATGASPRRSLRLQRIKDYELQVLGHENPLLAALGGMTASQMRHQVHVEEAIDFAILDAPATAETAQQLREAMEWSSRQTRQIVGLVLLGAKLQHDAQTLPAAVTQEEQKRSGGLFSPATVASSRDRTADDAIATGDLKPDRDAGGLTDRPQDA